MLQTKNLRDSHFLTIRQIRTKALVETRIEHAELREILQDRVTIVSSEPRAPNLPRLAISFQAISPSKARGNLYGGINRRTE